MICRTEPSSTALSWDEENERQQRYIYIHTYV